MKALIVLCFTLVFTSVLADDHKAFKIHVKHAYEKVTKQAPLPKLDSRLNDRATQCILGVGVSLESCVEDVEEYIQFLMATFKHNWVTRQFENEVDAHLKQAKAEMENMVITERMEPVTQKDLPVQPPTEEELRQYRQL